MKTSGPSKSWEQGELNDFSKIFQTWGHKSVTFDSESEVAQSCPTLCDPMDCSLPGSSLHEILQARVLEWVAISFSRGSSQLRDRTGVSHIPGRHFNLSHQGSPLEKKKFFFSFSFATALIQVSWFLHVDTSNWSHLLVRLPNPSYLSSLDYLILFK